MDVPPALLSALKEDIACQLIGFTLATTLYGISLLQAYLYFRSYNRDSLRLRVLVGAVVILDTLTTIFMAHGLYTYTVLDLGEPIKITIITWSFALTNGCAVLTAFLVQCHFGLRLWGFSSKNQLLVGLIALFAFCNLGAGVAMLVHMLSDTSLFSLGSVSIRVLSGLSSGASSVCDVIIAAGLCYYLQTSRSGFKQTDHIVDKLFIYSINRGALTAVCQTLAFVLATSLPGRFYFVPFALLESKLYANSLLATLNVRRTLKEAPSVVLGPYMANGETRAARPSYRDDGVSAHQPAMPGVRPGMAPLADRARMLVADCGAHRDQWQRLGL
ncbi:hypothetical protein BD413DRAFT_552413, partial [Trametes elegans]